MKKYKKSTPSWEKWSSKLLSILSVDRSNDLANAEVDKSATNATKVKLLIMNAMNKTAEDNLRPNCIYSKNVDRYRALLDL